MIYYSSRQSLTESTKQANADMFKVFKVIDRSILPPKYNKIIFYCEVDERSDSIEYYAFHNGEIGQCWDLDQDGLVEGYFLEQAFDKIADIIRSSKDFDPNKHNIITIIIEGSKKEIYIEKFSKSTNFNQIKKNWDKKYLAGATFYKDKSTFDVGK